MSKSIEEMAHDYVVACLISGKDQDDINVDVAIKMAEEVKNKATKVDSEREYWAKQDQRRGYRG